MAKHFSPPISHPKYLEHSGMIGTTLQGSRANCDKNSADDVVTKFYTQGNYYIKKVMITCLEGYEDHRMLCEMQLAKVREFRPNLHFFENQLAFVFIQRKIAYSQKFVYHRQIERFFLIAADGLLTISNDSEYQRRILKRAPSEPVHKVAPQVTTRLHRNIFIVK